MKNGFSKLNKSINKMSAQIEQLLESNNNDSHQFKINPNIKDLKLSFNSIEAMADFESRLKDNEYNLRVVSCSIEKYIYIFNTFI